MANDEKYALQISGLHKAFGNLEVLKGIDLPVPAGAVVGIIGGSGSGKSTLLRCVNYLEVPTQGDIYLDGELVGVEMLPGGSRRRLSERALGRQRQQMSMVFQGFNLWPHRSALENVMEALIVVKRMPVAEARDLSLSLLEKVGLADKRDIYPVRLSGGQQQRVGIARALALRPKVMLFDEPTSALDPELVGEVLTVIKDLAAEGMTMMIVTHEMSFAHEVCSDIVFIESGLIADRGPASYIFGPDAKERTKSFLRRYTGGNSQQVPL